MNLLKNLRRAIYLNEAETIRDVLSKNLGLFKDHRSIGTVKLLLLKATKHRNTEIIDLIMGTKENTKKIFENAVDRGDLVVVELLLKYGGARFDSENSPIYNIFARRSLRKEMLTIFLKYVNLNTGLRNKHGENFLQIFVYYFDAKCDRDAAEIAEILIDHGLSVNDLDVDGFSALHFAVEQQNFELMSVLVSKGADVNIRSKNFPAPLQMAAQYDDVRIVDLLLSNGADVNASDDFGCTPLHQACFYHNEPVIDLLIRRGADVSVEDNDGETPFSQLIFDGDEASETKIAMIKELSKLSFENVAISKSDIDSIHESPRDREHFEKCKNELDRMAKSKFYSSYSYYHVLKMSKNIKTLANLTKNKNFVRKFHENLSFHYYRDDLKRIFDEAVEVRDKSIIVRSRLCSVFGELFPDVVISKFANNLSVEDLPV